VGQTEVEPAGGTDARHQLLLLTLRLVALVGEDLLLGPHLAVVLNVGGHHEVRDGTSGDWDGLAAQWTHGHLDILFVRTAAAVIVVLQVVLAEYLAAGVTLHRKEVQLSACGLTAMSPQAG